MSSEYSIHLGDRPITGSVASLGPELPSTTIRLVVGDMSLGTGDPSTREGLILFVKDDRLLEMALLFHKIAQDLAALLPDVDACCRCVPGTPDDQCAQHGYGAHKIKTGCLSNREECLAYRSADPDAEPEESICTTACDQPTEAHCTNQCGCFEAGYEAGLEAERRPLGC